MGVSNKYLNPNLIFENLDQQWNHPQLCNSIRPLHASICPPCSDLASLHFDPSPVASDQSSMNLTVLWPRRFPNSPTSTAPRRSSNTNNHEISHSGEQCGFEAASKTLILYPNSLNEFSFAQRI
ncbi:hypothetical protein Fmac_005309 [Flemingia macrophylla]|uniref:Uncharacterized protein n=1 Tax=Flemingia macrophylla TaxID=520843 RepID=A0ABD1N7J5_9FABA